MSSTWIRTAALAVLAALLLCGAALGQTGEWNPVSTGPFNAWPAPLCAKGTLVVQPFLYFHTVQGIFDSDGQFLDLPEGGSKQLSIQQLFLQYGLTDRDELAALINYQQSCRSIEGGGSASSSGLADTALVYRRHFLREGRFLPEGSLFFQLKLPTGKYEGLNPGALGTDYMGTGSFDPSIGLNLTKKAKPFLLHADVIANFPLPCRIDGFETRYAPSLNYDFAAECFITEHSSILLELNGFTQGDMTVNGHALPWTGSQSLNLVAGVGAAGESIAVFIGRQRTLSGRNTDAVESWLCSFMLHF
ncbi:MAG: transporter [Candidatus Eremiobacteraeota bacterium]|nr:transporter [Candidatus Eremiobacteraeota bacterium]